MESPQPNERDMQVHYPRSYNNVAADTLFMDRNANDEILQKIIQLSEQNSQLQSIVKQKKENLPEFLLQWWHSNEGVQKISIFLQRLSKSLQKQIDSMSKKLCEYRGEYEMNEADYDKEVQQASNLNESIHKLQSEILALKTRLEAQDNELTQLFQFKESIMKSIKEIQQKRLFLKMENIMKNDNKQKIFASFNYKTRENIESKYFKSLQELTHHTLERKCKLDKKKQLLQSQIASYNEHIQYFQKEKEEKKQLKQNIILKHKRIRDLKQQLKQAHNQKQIAEAKKCELQDKICEEKISYIEEGLNTLTEKYKSLALRAVSLARDSLEAKPNISVIETSLLSTD